MSKPTLRNKGSALIIALVFLLILTLVGVTAMQGTSQQEIMAGNMRDKSLAFQAAEAALRYCIRTQLAPPVTLPSRQSDLPAGWIRRIELEVTNDGGNDAFWIGEFETRPSLYAQNRAADTVTTTEPSTPQLNGVAREASCLIEDIRSIDAACSSADGNNPLNCYRVTARGFGGTRNTMAIVQQTFYR